MTHPPRAPLPKVLPALVLALALTGCASTVPPVAGPPFSVQPNPPPMYVERMPTGAIFQPGMNTVSLFSQQRRPRQVGDVLKVNITEKLDVGRKVSTDIQRKNAAATKGPGSSNTSGLLGRLMNMDAKASGSDSFEGSGNTDSVSHFTGQITASVINVLANGHLVVAGERSITLNGSISNLRFAGVVDPQDVQAGNIVASTDVVNARFEVGGEGDVQDAASRSWVQRLTTRYLTVW